MTTSAECPPVVPPALLERAAEAMYLHDNHNHPHYTWEDASTVSKDFYRGQARAALEAVLASTEVVEELKVEADDDDGDPAMLRLLPGSALRRAREMADGYRISGFRNVRLRRQVTIKLPWALVLEEDE